MSKIDDLKSKWHSHSLSHGDILWMFNKVEGLENQLQRQIDIYGGACEERLSLKTRMGEMEKEAADRIEELEKADETYGKELIDRVAEVEKLHTKLLACRKIRRYVSRVLAGDEEADAQMAADEVQAKLTLAEDAIDTILQDVIGFNKRGPVIDGIEVGEQLPHIAHLCEDTLKQLREE